MTEPKRWNEQFAQWMAELSTLMAKKGDTIRSGVYRRAEEAILSMNTDIYSLDDIKGKPGIGPTILEKLDEFMKTGTLAMIERERGKPEYIFTDVYGIGPKKAKELVSAGITSIAELREKQMEVLNAVQRVGLKYYEDLLERIPRAEIDQYNELFAKMVNTHYEIVGSYRRGAATSGDIDVIFTSKDSNLLEPLVRSLKASGIILEILSQGKSKSLLICALPGGRPRRVDFLYASPKEFPFSILYFTGSKGFNVGMRAYALKRGYSLNEHGCTRIDTKEYLEQEFKDERAIFDFLGLKYKEPWERIDGRAVETLVEPSVVETKVDSILTKTIKPKKSPKQRKTKKLPKESLFLEKKKELKKSPKEVPMEKSIIENIEITELSKWSNQIQKPKKTRKKVPKSPKDSLKEIPMEKTKIPEMLNQIPMPKKTRKKALKKSPKESLKEIQNIEMPKESSKEIQMEKTKIPEMLNQIPKPKKTRKKVPKSLKEIQNIEMPKESSKEILMEKMGFSKDLNQIPKPKKTRKKALQKSPKESLKNKDIKTKTQRIKIVGMLPPVTTPVFAKIQEFKEKGISVLEDSNEELLSAMIRMTNERYYNTQTPLLTDNEYDILKDYMERKYPKNAVLQEVGAPIAAATKNKVILPFEMPSMDKIKPDTEALVHWAKSYTGPYILSCKLDGVSGLYQMDAKTPKLFTRGNGKVGQDITSLLKTLQLPRAEKCATPIFVRGEFILPKTTFETKYKADFANARNLVSGIINSKRADEKTRDLHFVAYEIVSPPMRPSEQMAQLTKMGFEVVRNETVPAPLTNSQLSAVLIQWRGDYMYEMDGVIVADDKVYPRASGNPAHAFAFKMMLSEQQAEAKVVDVLWTPSKNGYLKPRVQIEPVHLGGVTIEYATGFNGKFIEENRIGVGAVIQLVRSGDVIPYITGVTVPAERAKMPDVPYIWTDSLVDIVLENKEEDITVREKNVTGFFTHLEVDGLSTGNVKRLFAAGFSSVPVVLKMTRDDFEKVEGFKSKMIEKVYTSIHEKTGKASLLDIMVASNKMGRGLGDRKIRPILEAHPAILTANLSPKEKEDLLKSVKGIGKENAREFVNAIPAFLAFLEECGLSYKLREESPSVLQNIVLSAETVNHPLFQKKVVMTKVRDKAILEALAQFGATLEDGVKKDTFALIVKSKEDTSNKTEAAKKYGVPIFTPEEFSATYL